MKRYVRSISMILLACMQLAYGVAVTRGFVTSQGSSSAVMTINTSCVEQLSGDFNGEIVIGASNVTLDLRGFTVFGGTHGIRITGSNVTVQNGIVRGATIGVRVEGDNNYLVGLDLVANTTGMEIISNSNIISRCTASNNSSAGFSVMGGSRNSFYGCIAIDNGSTGNAYGFISKAGSGNVFQECVAERTQTTGGVSVIAAGFLLTGTEQKSKILNSQASNASGSNAYGVYLNAVVNASCSASLSLVPTATLAVTSGIVSAAWQQIGDSYYLALSDYLGSFNLQIAQFNPATQLISVLVTATFASGNNTKHAAWFTVGSSYFIAFAPANQAVEIFSFNPNTNALLLTASAAGAGLPVSVQSINSTPYIAAANSAIAQVYTYNPTTAVLTLVPSGTFNAVSEVRSAAWQQIGTSYYLAIVTTIVSGGPEFRILQFNPNTAILSQLATATAEFGVASAFGVQWQQIGNSYYVAVGYGDDAASNGVQVLQFNPNTQAVSSVATFTTAARIFDVQWKLLYGTYYLAAGGNGTGANKLFILQFNPSTLSLTSVGNAQYAGGTTDLSCQWQNVGASTYIAYGQIAGAGVPLRILQFDGCQLVPQNNIIMQNQASGNIIGFQDDAGNLNGNSINQWLGNFGTHNTANFTIGTQFPISAATGTGVGATENIDASLTNGGPAEKIMATIADQVGAQITSRLDAVITGGPTPIVGSTTLSADQSYYLPASLLSSVITITGINYVTLDLNGSAVKNIVIASSNFVTVKNGFVFPNSSSTNGIQVTDSGNVVLDSVQVSVGNDGLNVSNNISSDNSIVVRNCNFYSNSNRGVNISSTAKDYYVHNSGVSNNGFDGFYTAGSYGKFFACTAMYDSRLSGITDNEYAAIGGTGNLFLECSTDGTVFGPTFGFFLDAGNIAGACVTKGFNNTYTSGFGETVPAGAGASIQYWRNSKAN